MKSRMIKAVLFGSMLLLAVSHAKAQQGFGTDRPITVSAIEMRSESKGLLIPRVKLTRDDEFAPIRGGSGVNGTSPETNSLLVYNTGTSESTVPIGKRVRPGYYYWTAWEQRWNRLITETDIQAAVPQFFYAPAVYIPTHHDDGRVLTETMSIDLYKDVYQQQFAGASATYASSNMDSKLPVLQVDELDYFVTYWDQDVFDRVAVSAAGIMTYEIKPNAMVTARTFMNIVFKVRD